ncbi:MAG: diguanylate cyclase [Methylomonas sp.]|jgi:diguanylate cyclase (GGDEF)-like protein/PAS domain S-box-containing protein
MKSQDAFRNEQPLVTAAVDYKRGFYQIIQYYVGFTLLWLLLRNLLFIYLEQAGKQSIIFSISLDMLFVLVSAYLLRSLRAEFLKTFFAQNNQIKESEETLNRVLNGGRLGFWDWHIPDNIVKRNAIWAEMLGYKFEEIAFTTQQWSDFVHPDDREPAWASITAVLEGKAAVHEMSYRMKTKAGGYKWIMDRARVVERDGKGNPLRMTGAHTDIDLQKKIELALQESEYRFRSIFENAAVGIAQIADDGRFKLINDTFCRITGYDREELLDNGMSFQMITHPEDLENNLNLFNELQRGLLNRYELEKRYVRKDGVIAWVKLYVSAITGDQRQSAIISAVQDITQQKKLLAELEYQARIDYLTEVPNRRYFMELADREITRTQRYQQPLSIIMIDIDYFKQVNDRHGHKAGDLVLRLFTEIIRGILREVDIIGRLGGEEFAVLLPQTDAQNALEIAERIQMTINTSRMQIDDGQLLGITISMGVAALTEQEAQLEQLINNADNKLYQAKERGRNRIIAG